MIIELDEFTITITAKNRKSSLEQITALMELPIVKSFMERYAPTMYNPPISPIIVPTSAGLTALESILQSDYPTAENFVAWSEKFPELYAILLNQPMLMMGALPYLAPERIDIFLKWLQEKDQEVM